MSALVIVLGLACIVGIVAIISSENGRTASAARKRSEDGGRGGADSTAGYGFVDGSGADCASADSGGGCDGGGDGGGGGGGD